MSAAHREWLHLLTGDWQIIADIVFGDVLLAVGIEGTPIIAAQARPATAATLYESDVVGGPVDREHLEYISTVLVSGEQLTYGDDEVEITFVPVCHDGETIAVAIVVTALVPDTVPSQAQQNYQDIAAQLLDMITTGEFPFAGTPTGYRHGTPRVPDGIMHLDDEGKVLYASPNAVSHFRRLGVDEPLVDSVLAELVTDRIDDYSPLDESLPVVLMGRAAWMAELESHGVIVSMRAVPLRRNGERLGAILLCRDITELRRQERELITKDATIREIHHRVKNNLQTVSALLRLQSRRATTDESRTALDTAQRRVATIALVHERLSQNIDEVVDFDELFIPVLRMASDVAVTEAPVRTTFEGSFGRVRAEQATPLAIVMNEVISNAIEHGVSAGGEIRVSVEREDKRLHIEVYDDGVGIGEDGPGSGLGTQIVRTMVASELNGRIEWRRGEKRGTRVILDLLIDS